MSRIQTNVSALNAHRNLATNNTQLGRSIAKLSSGFRINRAADDAAGLAIANTLRSDGRSLRQASRNASQANSMLSIADGALNTMSSMMDRMKELATQAASDSIGDSQRTTLNNEFRALIGEIDRVVNITKYQGSGLLSGTFAQSLAVASSATAATVAGLAADSDITFSGTADGTYTVQDLGGGTIRLTDGTSNQTLTGIKAGSQTLSFNDFGVQVTLDSNFAVNGNNALAAAGTNSLDDNTTVNANGDIVINKSGVASQAGVYTLLDAGDESSLKLSDSNGNTQTVNAVAFDGSGGTIKFGSLGVEISLNSTFALNKAASLNAVSTNVDDVTSVSGISINSGGVTAAGTYTFKDLGGTRFSLNDGTTTDFATITGNSLTFGTTHMLKVDLSGTQSLGTVANDAGVANSVSGHAGITGATVANPALGTDGTYTLTSDGAGTYTLTHDVAGLALSDTFDGTAAADGTDITFAALGVTINVGGAFDTDESGGANVFTNVDKVKLDVSGGDFATSQSIVVDSAQTGSFGTSGTTNNQFTVTAGAGGSFTGSNTNIVVEGGETARSFLVSSTGSYASNDVIKITALDLRVTTLGLNDGNAVHLKSISSAQNALTTIDKALKTFNEAVGELGTAQNRLDFAITNTENSIENIAAAESIIRDADLAFEMVEFTKNQILQQASTAMLAQANSVPQSVLSLIGG